MPLRQRFLELQAALNTHQPLWRASPFYERRPPWCAQWPTLAEAALQLDDSTLEHLSGDPAAFQDWLAPRLPVATQLERLCELPALPPRELPPPEPSSTGRSPSASVNRSKPSPPTARPPAPPCWNGAQARGTWADAWP
jgi:hypothetical protein